MNLNIEEITRKKFPIMISLYNDTVNKITTSVTRMLKLKLKYNSSQTPPEKTVEQR